MSKQLTVTVEECLDGLSPDDKGFSWQDWTPRENRVLARRLQVDAPFGYVALTETEKNDPTMIDLYVNLEVGRELGRDGELSVVLRASELDAIISALTFARDAAIANWMLEPATA